MNDENKDVNAFNLKITWFEHEEEMMKLEFINRRLTAALVCSIASGIVIFLIEHFF